MPWRRRWRSELGERVRLGSADRRAPRGRATSIASCSQSRFRRPRRCSRPARARELRRLQWGVAAKLHVPLGGPAPAGGRAGARGRLLDVDDRCGDGRRLVRRRPRRAGVACDPDRARALARRPAGTAARAGAARRCGAHELGDDDPWCGGSYACHPPGWSQRDDEAVAAPPAASTWRASTPRRSSAERWKVRSGAAPGRLPRCSQRLAATVDLCPICDLHW